MTGMLAVPASVLTPVVAPAAVPGRDASQVPVPSWGAVALSLVLVAIAIGLAERERLGLSRDLAVAAARAAAQLVAVGALLRLLFEHTGVAGSLGWVVAMVVVAGRVAGGRAAGLPRAVPVATAAAMAGVTVTLGLLVGAGIIASRASVVVPVGGMVVSSCMQATTLTLARLRDEVATGRRQVEARLALGLPPGAAFAPHRRTALRAAVVPSVDQARVVGLIALPGAMTGLIIAGVPPLLAIRYQIVVTYLILGSYAVSAGVAAALAQRVLFDTAARLHDLEQPARRRGPWELLRRRAAAAGDSGRMAA